MNMSIIDSSLLALLILIATFISCRLLLIIVNYISRLGIEYSEKKSAKYQRILINIITDRNIKMRNQ